ncbi:hypothetical protein [Consotaella aegiceratis]|uniref:hypothetical protein n=1 Tax=Consotaella aegiceratis TaxID=3097961 RepID=UPI002F3E876E
MDIFRQLFRDRSAALAAVVLLSQVLLLQGFTTAILCCQQAVGVAGDGIVICHADPDLADAANSASPRQDLPAGCCLDCICGMTCAAHATLFAAIPPLNDIGDAWTVALAQPRPGSDERPVQRPRLAGLVPVPRGPPLSFI